MAQDYLILLLTENPETGEGIGNALRRAGLEAIAARDTADALKKMGLNAFDMIVAETHLGDSSGLDFMAEARNQMPMAVRVLIENRPIDMDRRRLVNRIGPHAIFTDPPTAEDIGRLLALEGPVSQAAYSATAMARIDTEKMRQRVRQLETENRILGREVELLQREKERLRKAKSIQPAPEQKPAAVDEFHVSRTAGAVLRAVDQLMQEPEIVLPVLPAVGLEVQRMVADDKCSFEELAHRVELEQGMASRLLQVANSPMYAGLERIHNLQQAVSRLGLRETRNILQAVVAENLFRTRDRSLARLMAQLWMHSLCTAYANESIARTLEIANSDDYFMLGLLHDIGKLLVLKIVAQLRAKGQLARADVTDEIIRGLMDASHHEFGVRLLERWLYSATFRSVVAHHNDDKNIANHDEPVVVTYFANLLTRKVGFSLVPYREGQLENSELAEALNITTGTRLLMEKQLEALVKQIQGSYFAKAKPAAK